MLAYEAEYGLFDKRSKRLDRIEGERRAANFVGVKIPDRRMRATRRERDRKPPGRDGKDDVQECVERMRRMSLRSGLTVRS
jgi:hypothetical protein